MADVGKVSGGRLPADPGAAYGRWSELLEWSAGLADEDFESPFPSSGVGPPSPAPRQVFGVGTNYRQQALDVGWPIPEVPMVFPKFPSAVAGPNERVELSGPRVDWEVELVVVVGAGGHRIRAIDAWDAIAGFTVGQDISDRDVQTRPDTYPQFGLGKSFPKFAPTGPIVVTRDEIGDPHDLGLRCWVNDDLMQDGNTDDLVFSIPFLIEYLSNIVTLLPGDLIFTGTPAGTGSGSNPPRFLVAGDRVRSRIEGIGEMTTIFEQRR
ncbi:fumarylacetoacetate hydrolase family protein [Nocardia sp. NPDC004860]|uniref:fumarylacetoacetate hydrolase family protein n=1 Tax=Nocardia sp. NPDC004860 TaxID=3154557 RepID=UPI0033A243C7